MKRTILTLTFAVYLLLVAAVTIVPTRISRGIEPHSSHINLVPFDFTIRCFQLAALGHRGLTSYCLRNLFGNIALFVPLGILLPSATRFRSLKLVMLVAVFLSVAIEAIQFALRFVGNARAVDIDDVLLNTLGACLGYVLFTIKRTVSAE